MIATKFHHCQYRGTIRTRHSSNHSPIMTQTTSQAQSIPLCIIPESNQIPWTTRGFPLTLSKECVPGQLREVMSPPVLISAVITGSGSLSESALAPLMSAKDRAGPNVRGVRGVITYSCLCSKGGDGYARCLISGKGE
ncbi:hypothetical protein CEXT_201951 [Caerostris extrusa]|uniref:Uncharacterized protein n=1 Tax=Caerostris extrusa TaxID=172846 RepID=A0AAV4T7L6_CAEEX|nr:hypothetical protein CEXT_201951 [Caerostris extrusa]